MGSPDLRILQGKWQLVVIEGNLGVKIPAIWADKKAEVGRVREEKRRRKKIREEKEPEERRCRRTKGKAEKSRNTLFFMFFQ